MGKKIRIFALSRKKNIRGSSRNHCQKVCTSQPCPWSWKENFLVLNPRRFCWHLRTGGCPKKKTTPVTSVIYMRDTSKIKKMNLSNKFQRYKLEKTAAGLSDLFTLWAPQLPSLFCLVMDIFFGGPDVCPFLHGWVEVQNSSSKKVARHLGSKVKRGHGFIEILQILLQTLHTCP